MKRSTLKEVAKLAGVSTATVSNALNETKYVSEEVKDKINKAIEELNYQPNIVAKSLRVQESRIIGVLISDVANPFFSIVVRGIEEELSKSNYSILLCNTDSSVEKERKYLEVMIGKRVDGLVVSSAGNSGDYFRSLDKTGVPIVFLNRCPEFMNSDVIMTNNIQGAYSATEHLIRHGYGKIAIITGPSSISTGKDRLIGYKRALEDYGVALSDTLVKEGLFTIQSGYDKMKELMEQDSKPDAVFVSNNSMTLGAYKYLKEAGIRIPDQIAVLGYDDPDWADIVDPPITTVRQPAYQLGVHAANLMLVRINEKQVKREIMYMDTTLIIRRSCGCTGE
ncbi:LacI family transcriptional regulator [Paenibacillus alginolyticus]|uniref:LacI family transcriptional regulator n=1 Tax=Paenibacillus alginolyticus TaxID=59839 RepID=A0ABT4G660_9BACL|nr:LacI family DNA-binding transcriptional regulator [Paenibacillus alginolyticus]MCY9668638.1 LacI family transcriptional regulator [Paenibacillus alginolyticus]MCY9691654.1 LacI family transcriptional regulator [Paenibacillus alginolyticus]MEC0146910.1 LacI family DNA-binding transcriptional regulator [Paenibacillus alginolyticus]